VTKLREVAHARSGDKGDTVNISLVAFHERDYPRLREQITVDRVKEAFGDLVRGEVRRYELPKISALNFVLYEALEGGVTRSLRLDAHGKSFASLLLDLEIE
jgi:hypothetical protein